MPLIYTQHYTLLLPLKISSEKVTLTSIRIFYIKKYWVELNDIHVHVSETVTSFKAASEYFTYQTTKCFQISHRNLNLYDILELGTVKLHTRKKATLHL